jgi:anti-anti-sigma factor
MSVISGFNGKDRCMEITVTPYKNWKIVEIDGKFVMKSLGQAIKAFDALEKGDMNFIAIDLNATTHLDSTAINFLVGVLKRILQKNGRLVFFGANDDITGIINIVGLDTTFLFYKTRLHFELSLKNNDS